MIKETSFCFDLEDIRLIHFECKDCGSRFSIPLAKWDKNAAICGNCRESLIKVGSVEESAMNGMKQAVGDLLRLKSNLPFRLRFEVRFDPREETA